MIKRRNIRETAIQFLYLADLENGPEASEIQEAFWHIVQENSLRKLTKAEAKAILHVAQARQPRIERFTKLTPLKLAELKTADGTSPLVADLNRLARQEHKLGTTIDQLKLAYHNTKGGDTIPPSVLHDVISTNRNLISLRKAWLHTLEDFPHWKNKLESLTSAVDKLDRISKRLDAIQNPDSTLNDFGHLRASSEEISLFRKETQSVIQDILQHKENIDQTLASVIENFAPERVDPVDRAILRLATYEIKHCPDTPRAVSINEAIEIAKRFGTTDSARFVNGVLDAIRA